MNKRVEQIIQTFFYDRLNKGRISLVTQGLLLEQAQAMESLRGVPQTTIKPIVKTVIDRYRQDVRKIHRSVQEMQRMYPGATKKDLEKHAQLVLKPTIKNTQMLKRQVHRLLYPAPADRRKLQLKKQIQKRIEEQAQDMAFFDAMTPQQYYKKQGGASSRSGQRDVMFTRRFLKAVPPKKDFSQELRETLARRSSGGASARTSPPRPRPMKRPIASLSSQSDMASALASMLSKRRRAVTGGQQAEMQVQQQTQPGGARRSKVKVQQQVPLAPTPSPPPIVRAPRMSASALAAQLGKKVPKKY